MADDEKRKRFVCLVSTGIDSPVAAYLMSRYADIILVHAYNYPFVDEIDKEVFLKIAERLHKVTKRVSKLYVVPHGITLSEIKKRVRESLTCVMCKRFMLRYGKEIAGKENADAIVTGDSLGQVASQTLDNIFVEQYELRFPVIRPLIGFDKDEIVRIAKEIGTYDISIEKNISCKAAPRKPATRAKIENVLEEEKRLDVDRILEEVMSKVEIIQL